MNASIRKSLFQMIQQYRISSFFIFSLLACLPSSFLKGEELKQENSKILIAFSARNQAFILPKFLQGLDLLDYDKKLISLHIQTNHNTDNTKELLLAWLKEHQNQYASIHYENNESVPQEKLSIGEMKTASLKKTKEWNCDYYFALSCDSFIKPYTLKELLLKDKPIIAPFLQAVPEPEDCTANFFYDTDANGYYRDHPEYWKILYKAILGTFKVPVIHSCYLVKAQYIDQLSFTDGSGNYDFIVFSRIARKNAIDQYICNEKDFGTFLHFYSQLPSQEQLLRLKQIKVIEDAIPDSDSKLQK